ncbi:hypothetical protein [Sphingosinicella sp. BN140058]|uniref:hypothetical protein n=1 Tax=Sphingosinicella sp. BN140058 TaxID=1892855 RepID=UPI00197FD692|nr:hypothetical protein [Sphingosinicella sp. BN140058]
MGNVRYPTGAIGCVSRNYEDRQWRIACDPRPFEERPTFANRDEAAIAEWYLANGLKQPVELPVIFRMSEGQVSAVFPTLPFDRAGDLVTVYDQAEQHNGASFGWYKATKPATPAAYEPLLTELRRIYEQPRSEADTPYRLIIARRMTAQHRAAFQAEASRKGR